MRALPALIGIGGIAAGFAVAATLGNNSTDSSSKELSTLRGELMKARAELSSARASQTTLKEQLQAATKRAQSAEQKLATAAMKQGNNPPDLIGSKPPATVANGQLTEEQKSRIAELKKQLPTLVQDKDGKALIAALRELRSMGEGAYPLIIEIANIINKDMWRGGNKLNIKMQDYYISFPANINNWALQEDNFATAGPEFRIHAAHGIMWTATPGKDKILINALMRETEEWAIQQMVQPLAHRPDEDTGKALIEKMTDNPDMPKANWDAMMDIVTRMPGAEVDEFLQQQYDLATDDATRDSLGLSITMRNPAETGYMIRGVNDESQASNLGLKPGDIITSYGGNKLSDMSLTDAKSKASGESIEVQVYRNGQMITVLMKPGQIGIDGKSVVKK